MIKLDILSDPICPWCYIGKSRLESALSKTDSIPFAIEWHPFQLNPDMPPEGMDRREYLETKFGGRDRALQAYLPIHQAAEQDGLTLNLDKIARTPNTLDAHRLIHWAGLEGKQNAVVDALFAAYFVDGRDIGENEVLLDLAEAVGMERKVVARLLASDADKQDIQDRDRHSRERGVSGVPCFIIANQHVVAGAQPASLWAQIVDDLMSPPSSEEQVQ